MAEERTRILRMVAEGTIEVEQAEQLLEALADTDDQKETAGERAGAIPPLPPVPPPRVPRFRISHSKFGEPGKGKAFDFDHVIQLAALGISPGYIKDLKKLDPHLSFEQAVQVGSIGIDPSRFKELKEAFGSQLDFDQLLQMAALGVSPEYLKELKKEFSVEEDDQESE